MNNLSKCWDCKHALIFGDEQELGMEFVCMKQQPNAWVKAHIQQCNRYEKEADDGNPNNNV